MSASVLTVHRSEGTITVAFADSSPALLEKSVSVRAVLDIGPIGDIIGVEILNLRHHTGCVINRPYRRNIAELPDAHLNYDPSADVLYVRLGGDRSTQQPTVEVIAVLDAENALLRLEVPTTVP